MTISQYSEQDLNRIWEEKVLVLKTAFSSLCSEYQIYRFLDRGGFKEDGEKITADELIGIFQMDFSTHIQTRSGYIAISNLPLSSNEFNNLFALFVTWKNYERVKDVWVRRRLWDALRLEVDASKSEKLASKRPKKPANRPIRTAP